MSSLFRKAKSISTKIVKKWTSKFLLKFFLLFFRFKCFQSICSSQTRYLKSLVNNVNGHLHIKKRFSLFQDFLHIFLDFLQPVHLATLKTALCCFGEVCKSYCFFGSDWQKISWTKLCHTTMVHLWHHWYQHTSFYHDC